MDPVTSSYRYTTLMDTRGSFQGDLPPAQM